ncbi:helix-turn-helix domain-containing protein [Peptococcus simiae]|uniref:Helix-turn-helix domain-containing protein n=2 Tax=Peptococcus simiae TaxID=1643805 RepID=A0ABW9GYZ2_9FIRM
MEYAKLLKWLIDVSDQKLQDIANLLFYDFSYISKWINGKSIPSISSVSAIHNELASLFSSILFNSDKKDTLSAVLAKNANYSTQSMLNKSLYNGLTAAYFETYRKSNVPPLETSEDHQVIVGKKKIAGFLYALFAADLDLEHIEVFSTLPTNQSITLLDWFDQLWLFGLKAPVTLNLLVDALPQAPEQEDLLCYIKALGLLSYYDLNIFTYTDTQTDSPYLYVKNKFVVFFQSFYDGQPLMITFSKNPDLLKHLNRNNNRLFRYSSPLLKTIDNFAFEKSQYEQNLAGDKAKIFTSYIDGCLSDTLQLKQVLSKNKVNQKQAAILDNLLALQGYAFSNKHYEITFNVSSLLASIESRKVSVGPYYLTLPKTAYKRYLKSLKENLTHLDQHTYAVIDTQYMTNFNWDYYMSFILRKNSFIMKKLDPFDTTRFKYLVSYDPSVCRFISQLLAALQQTTYVRNISIEDIKSLIASKLLALEILDKATSPSP